MGLSTRKTVLGALLFAAIVSVLICSFYLNRGAMLSDMHRQERLLRISESGRLVVRSQLDFHHVKEWEPMDAQSHSKRRKERLIEDGHIVREAIEYPIGENEDDQHMKVQTRAAFVHGQGTHSPISVAPPLSHENTTLQNVSSGQHMQRPIKVTGKSSSNKSIPSRGTNDSLSHSKSDAGKNNSTPFHSHYNKSKSVEPVRSGTRQVKKVSIFYRNSSVAGRSKKVQPSKILNSTSYMATKHSNSKPMVKKSSNVSKMTDSVKSQNKLSVKRSSGVLVKHAPYQTLKSVDASKNSLKSHVVNRQYTTKKNDSKQSSPRYSAVFKSDQHEPYKYSPSLVLETHRNHSKYFEDRIVDYNNDSRYAKLPEAVRKKLIAIQNERLKKVEFLKLIRKRCEGKKFCLPYVKSDERYLQNQCFHAAIMMEKNNEVEISPCNCKMFRSITTIRGKRVYPNITHPRVALVSLPGSGNTWVRGLLEQATGYCTGSMWCDPVLRAKQFCAEGIRADTLVIKNHDPTIRWVGERLPVNSSENLTFLNKPTFHSAIFIHRDPYDATIAEWNRALGSLVRNATKYNQTIAGIGFYNSSNLKDQHTVFFGKEAFGANPEWNKTIYTQMENWEKMITHLLVNNTGSRPILLVKYEDLKKDVVREVERMIQFLSMSLGSDVEKQVRDGFHKFHRNHTQAFEHYTDEQKVYVNSVIKSVDFKLKTHNIDYLRVTKYLRD